jgi:signal transduction histidine kinase
LEIAIDITDRKKMEMEMEEHRDHLQMLVWGKTQELMESQRRLIDSEKLAALGKLAGSIAHEIRNPLAVMQNAIYYLMDSKSSKDTATIREYLAIIKRNIGISDKIITNVLNFAKQKKVDLIRSSINKTIDEALSKISIPKEIKIEKCYAADSEISHDVSLTEEVFHNLILNSMQAIRKEGLLKISTFKDGECTKITIEDNGEGITKADLPRIFEPLFSKKETGVGFGMSIVKDIVDKHGWEIGIESTEGKGTTVTIMIPGQCAG